MQSKKGYMKLIFLVAIIAILFFIFTKFDLKNITKNPPLDFNDDDTEECGFDKCLVDGDCIRSDNFYYYYCDGHLLKNACDEVVRDCMVTDNCLIDEEGFSECAYEIGDDVDENPSDDDWQWCREYMYVCDENTGRIWADYCGIYQDFVVECWSFQECSGSRVYNWLPSPSQVKWDLCFERIE